jgi:hypothetical protein
MMAGAEESAIVGFTGVYEADGTLAGELAYWIGAHVTGTRHCALCEITHGSFREKARWRELADALPVSFEAVHLDERDPAVAAASEGRAPCVLALREGGEVEVVLDATQLEALDGDPDRLAGALRALL